MKKTGLRAETGFLGQMVSKRDDGAASCSCSCSKCSGMSKQDKDVRIPQLLNVILRVNEFVVPGFDDTVQFGV